MTDPIPVTQPRPPHQILVDEFMELDKECQELIEKFLSGRIIYDSIPPEGAATHKEFFEKMVVRFNQFQEHLKNLIDKRNAKLQEASNAMRAQVMAAETFVRGPDGKGSFDSYGPFKVESRTFRSFNTEKLFGALQQKGLYGRLRELTTIDKDTGAPIPVVREEIKIDYKPTQNWLREQNLEDILQLAYEEEEGTPAVTGPKPLAWVGETDKSSKKGKK